MPTYEYVCDACQAPLEAVQSFTDSALTTCPACGQERLRKVFGSVGVVFKGAGFYRTDSRPSSGSDSTSTSTSSTSDSTTSTSTSSTPPSTS